MLCPATVVPPYPVEQRFVESLGDHKFSNYVEWLTIAYAITLTGHPALSIPAGFTEAGLPVGLQMVGGPRGEASLLMAAELYEKASSIEFGVPIDPITPYCCVSVLNNSLIIFFLARITRFYPTARRS